ncbi:MAG: hypothetical protein JWP97_4547 [Labilithrix sp.]|nr:hypothetical protein [Labilithrix sp.]
MRLSPVVAAFVVAIASVVGKAHAEPADPAKDAQVARLLEAKKTLHWNQSVGGSKERYGHAETLVDAPAEKVAKTATEFGKYRELHRKFAGARVIAKEGDKTDVYMKYPVTIGPMTIEMYEVMRFDADRATPAGTHVIEAHGIKGDMKRGHTLITIKPVDARHSLVEVDVLLVPTLPAPQSYVDEELRDGAYDFVSGLRDRAQTAPGPVTAL